MNVQMDLSPAVGVERLFCLLEGAVRRTTGSWRVDDRVDCDLFVICTRGQRLAKF